MVDGDVNQGFCRLGQGVVGWEHICVSEGRVGASGNVVGGREPSCVCVCVVCVRVNMYVYMYGVFTCGTCMRVSGCMYTCVCVHVYVCVHVCVYLCVHVCDIV